MAKWEDLSAPLRLDSEHGNVASAARGGVAVLLKFGHHGSHAFISNEGLQ